MPSSRPFSFYLLLTAVPALPLLGLVARVLPDPLRPQCLSHRLTGLPCPGCGSFRALCHFSSGHWENAFLTQPLMTLLFTALMAASLAAWVLLLRKKTPPLPPALSARAWKWLIAAGTAAVLINWGYLIATGV